ncbi:hypothetical protein JCM19992_07860 [Thermostilla marina]
MKHLFTLIAATALAFAFGHPARAAITWVDPDTYAIQDPITAPGVTFKAILGATTQTPPNPDTVYALIDDKGHYPASNHFFGWHSKGANVPYKVAWRGKWAKFQAEFDSPVAFVSLDFLRNDFSGGPKSDEIGFLEAYDADWNLVKTVDVSIAMNDDVETATIICPTPQIKYVIASGKYVAGVMDHDILLDNLGFSTEPVPEPGVLTLLFGGGLAGIGCVVWRRRRNHA